MPSQSDLPHIQPHRNQAFELLKTLIKQTGLTRKEFLDRLADLGSMYSEDDLKNWGRKGRSFPREALRPMVQVLVGARTSADPKRCTAIQALEFLGLAGLSGNEFPSLTHLFSPDEFNLALKTYFQIDSPLSMNGAASDVAKDDKDDRPNAVSGIEIPSESIDLEGHYKEAVSYPGTPNKIDKSFENTSVNRPVISQMSIPVASRRTKRTIVIVLAFALMITVVPATLFGKPHFVAVMPYQRGIVSMSSADNPYVLNPVITCVEGGSIDSSCAISKGDGALILTAGGHTILAKDAGNNELAPVVSLSVFGDFTAQVKVIFRPGPKCCKHAGLGVRSVDGVNSWIRISRDHADTIQVDGLFRGRTTNSSDENYTSDRVWFRIERRGDLFTLDYSSNGVDWTSVRKDYEIFLSEDAQIFLFTYSAYQQDMVSAEFSDLSVR